MNDSNVLSEHVKTIWLKDYKPYPFKVLEVNLFFDIRDEFVTVEQRSMFIKLDNKLSHLVLDAGDYLIDEISLNQNLLSQQDYLYGSGKLEIFDVPNEFFLIIKTKFNPLDNKTLSGLYISNGLYCTQCESEGFRQITPFPDRPDVLTKFSTRIQAESTKYPILLSNGNLINEVFLDDGRHECFWEDPFPKPSYLFALVAGNLGLKTDSFTTTSGRNIELRIYAEVSDLERTEYALNSLKNSMKWDEKVFGREYDLDLFMIVAVSHFNHGAMENKGLNIFNTNCILASAETTTDQAFERVEAVVAHEYFHNWSGNRVTCRDWFQLSLKEGFTVFRDAEFSSDMNSRSVKRIQDANLMRTAQFLEDSGPTSHAVQPDSYIEISNFYTITIYEKGAEIVRMLSTLLGEKKFRKGSDLYFSRFDGQAVTIEDFVTCMAEVSGRDLNQFMHWYKFPGTPTLKVKTEYDENNRTLCISLEQIPSSKIKPSSPQFLIPIRLSILGSETGNQIVKDHLIELVTRKRNIVYENITEKPVASVLRGFTAPVRLDYPLTKQDRVAIVRFDNDGVSRWDSMQSLYCEAIKSIVYESTSIESDVIVDLISKLIEKPGDIKDPGGLTEILRVPSESILWEKFQPADPQIIFKARNRLGTILGCELQHLWSRLVDEMIITEDYLPTSEQIGRRSLKAIALSFLVRSSDRSQMLNEQFTNASNLTDRLLYFRLARAHGNAFIANQLSKIFEQSAVANETFELWLSVEASDERTGTLEKLKELAEHPRFSFDNPNRVRAVYRSFAVANTKNFHQDRGYSWLKDRVIELDKINPMMASMMVRPLCRWKLFTETYGNLMLKNLNEIGKLSISNDLFEIISKSISE